MDVERVRKSFPILNTRSAASRLIYFDNACTSLKPDGVIDATLDYYRETPVCGGRSIHRLGERVSGMVETARRRLGSFIGARGPEDIVFTANTTAAINLVARGLPWKRGDVVLTTDKEHNSNWVPWLRLRQQKGIDLVPVASHEDGTFDEAAFERALYRAGDKLRLVSVAHVSNADGVETPVKKIAQAAHDHGAEVLVDGAQSAPHLPIDVRDLQVDYFAASSHKMLGPSGLGFLYGTAAGLDKLEPLALGGGTVHRSSDEGYELNKVPLRFEAGLQNYAALAAFPAALDFLDRVGREWIRDRDRALNAYATKRLGEVKGVTLYGPAPSLRGSILPFNVDGIGSHDVALFLDESRNVAVRSGAHCVNAYFERRGLDGWVRASFYLYNTRAEVDSFVHALGRLVAGVKAAPRAGARRPVTARPTSR